MSACAAQPESAGFIGSIVHFMDCRAEALGSGAWQALALPGSTLSVVLAAFLTIFIALIGYNLLLGRTLTVRTGTLAMVKIGIVLALATTWPAYRTLVYDVVVEGPGDLVAEIGPSAQIAGSDGTLLRRLDQVDRGLTQLAIVGPGFLPMQMGVAPDASAAVAPPPFAGFNAFALGGSRIIFLLTVLGGLAAVRMVAGLMLALGPIFVAFLMFDNTRGLFEGWVRVLAGAALGSVAIAVTLGVELALMEPWLASVLVARAGGTALPSIPTEMLVVTSMFAILALAVIVASAWLARGFRMTQLISWPERVLSPLASGEAVHSKLSEQMSLRTHEERNRAAALADVLQATQRREALMVAAGGSRPGHGGSSHSNEGGGHSYIHGVQPPQRRNLGRISASAGRRDRRS